jgi:hypothetical protein
MTTTLLGLIIDDEVGGLTLLLGPLRPTAAIRTTVRVL